MQTALARWHEVHDARARQMDAAYAKLGRTSADMWKRRAGGYQRATRDSALGDPFFEQVRSFSDPLKIGKRKEPGRDRFGDRAPSSIQARYLISGSFPDFQRKN